MQKINQDKNPTEAQIIEAGYLLLSGEELNLKMQNKTIFGEYLYGRQYISYAHSSGTVEGVNDLGSYVKGRWSINKKDKTLTLKWGGYWDDWTGRAYDVNGEIKFFDIETRQWRTTFKKFKDENFFIKSKSEFDSKKSSFFRPEQRETISVAEMKDKKLKISNKCIGCGHCVEIEPIVFEINPENSHAKIISQTGGNEKVIQSIKQCPVSAISFI